MAYPYPNSSQDLSTEDLYDGSVPTTIRQTPYSHQGSGDTGRRNDPGPQPSEQLPNDVYPPHVSEASRQTTVRRMPHSRPESGSLGHRNDVGASPGSSHASILSNSHQPFPSSETSERPPTDEDYHTLEVCRNTADGPRPVQYLSVRPVLMIYARMIYEMIEEDRKARRNITTVTAKEPVTVEALIFMLNMIMRGIPQQGQTTLAFDRFLDLAVACWHHQFPISLIQHWADERHENLWNHDFPNRTPGQFRSWMFLALIFGWPDVFTSASMVLISECSVEDDGAERKRFLPEELELAIQTKRTEVLSSAYDFVHEKYLEQVEQFRRDRSNPLFDAIPQDLENELGIKIIKKCLSEDLVKVTSSSKLLNTVDSTIRAALEPPPGAQSGESLAEAQSRLAPPTPTRQPPRASTHKSRHSPGARAGVFNDPRLIEDAKEGLKKGLKKGTKAIGDKFQRSKNQPEILPENIQPDGVTRIDTLRDVCRNLQLESAEFRKENFCGLDIRDYLPLRASHVPP